MKGSRAEQKRYVKEYYNHPDNGFVDGFDKKWERKGDVKDDAKIFGLN